MPIVYGFGLFDGLERNPLNALMFVPLDQWRRVVYVSVDLAFGFAVRVS